MSFIFYWKLTLILTWPILLGVIPAVGDNKVGFKYSEMALDAYSAGGAIAEEAFGSIKSITALGMQQDIVDGYKRHLVSAEKSSFLLKSFYQCLMAFAVGACWLNVACLSGKGLILSSTAAPLLQLL